jgi:hypothetical protein
MDVNGQRHAPAVLYLRGKNPWCIYWIRGWVGLRGGLDTEARGKILCLWRGSNPCPVCSQTMYWLSYPQLHFNICKRKIHGNRMNGVVIGLSCCMVVIEAVFPNAQCTLMLSCVCKQLTAPAVIWLPGLPCTCHCVVLSTLSSLWQ